jgi:6-phosphogluconolactonase
LEIVIQKDLTSVSKYGAELFVSLANDAIKRNNRFSVALSGGSTPRELYRLLASSDFRDQVRWDNVYFFFGDERCVPPDSPESNYRMALETMLAPLAISESNVFRWSGETEPQRAADEYETQLRNFFASDRPVFDFILLGMGPDGHTASLFPNSAAIHETTRNTAANWVEKLDSFRLTLTFAAINNARDIVFLVVGSDKADVLRNVVQENNKTVEELPSKGVRPVSGTLTWLIDKAAGGSLDQTTI